MSRQYCHFSCQPTPSKLTTMNCGAFWPALSLVGTKPSGCAPATTGPPAGAGEGCVVLDAAPEGVGAAGRVAPVLDVGDTSGADAPGAAAAIVLSLVMVTAVPDWLVHAAVSTVSAAHTAVAVRRDRLFTPNPRRVLHRLSAGAFRLRCCSRVLLPSGRCRPSQMLGVDRFKWRSAPASRHRFDAAARRSASS
jgi:hypothetical protein